ncbi:MAG: FtsX-like permease family protein [Rhodothermales bacterium]|nr:FtsX-like permease family protein [Rhodothermales bacterium]
MQGGEEGRRFLRFVTYAAVGGVAVGVAALLLAFSIVRGFSREIEAKIVGFGAHVQVESYVDAPLSDAATLQARLAAMPGVERVAPVVTEFALLRRSSTDIDGVALWGTDALPTYLAGAIVSGSADLEPGTGGPRVILGEALARQLGVDVGDRLTAFSLRQAGGGDQIPVFARPRARQFSVAGIYATALADFDELYVFTDLATARDLLEYGPEQVTRYDLTLADVTQAAALAEAVEAEFGYPVMARTIYQVFRGLFAWVNLQESIIPLVIGVIVLVAAFNIVGTLLMIILEKTREIGVMGSMGASRRDLRRLFLWLGLLVGAAGTGTGMALALGFGLLQQRFGIIPLPAEAYYMDTAPVELNPLDFVIVGAVALVLCAVAAYVPARVAARIDPLKVIRFA